MIRVKQLDKQTLYAVTILVCLASIAQDVIYVAAKLIGVDSLHNVAITVMKLPVCVLVFLVMKTLKPSK